MNQKWSNAKIILLMYVLAIVLSAMLLFLIGLPFMGPGQLWISFLALVIGETAIFGLLMQRYGYADRKRPDVMLTGFLAHIAVAVVYLIAVVILILLALMTAISVVSYLLLHIVLLMVAGIASGFIVLFARYVRKQEQDEKAQWVKLMKIIMVEINQYLALWNGSDKEQLKTVFEELEEKVRYSDPVSTPELAPMEWDLLEQARQLAASVRSLTQTSDAAAASTASGIAAQMREMTSRLTLRNEQLLQAKS